MEKYRRGLVGEIKQEFEQEEEQERLHEKYQEQDPDVVIVETSNTMKFLIRTAGGVVKTLAVIALLVLAAAGLLALVYPETRDGLQKICEQSLEQLREFLQ
ncbi:hypothetical protein ACTQW9_10760 [Lachnospiraceae bacterium LCP19S3_B12]